MKKVILSIFTVLLCGFIMLNEIEAQTRPGTIRTSTSGQRPGRSNNKENSQKPLKNSRPSEGSHSHGSRQNRPSHKYNRPSNPGNTTHPNHFRSGNVTRPGRHISPVHRSPVRRPATMIPPNRPGRLSYSYWSRPVPPSSWRPGTRTSLIGNFLGLTFGLTINTTLDRLYGSGYDVDGYGSEYVYLRNVHELNYRWADATLCFSNGMLTRSQFYVSTGGYNPTRYNNVYTSLCSRYGNPVCSTNTGASMSVTWFGYSGDYICLEYKPMYNGGAYRYYTVLTYGN